MTINNIDREANKHKYLEITVHANKSRISVEYDEIIMVEKIQNCTHGDVIIKEQWNGVMINKNMSNSMIKTGTSS